MSLKKQLSVSAERQKPNSYQSLGSTPLVPGMETGAVGGEIVAEGASSPAGHRAALPRVRNYHVTVREYNDLLIFLRKVLPGATDKSHGIQVARLAGVPRPVIDRAREILRVLEEAELNLQNVLGGGEGSAGPGAVVSPIEAAKPPRITPARRRDRESLQALPPTPQLDLFSGQ